MTLEKDELKLIRIEAMARLAAAARRLNDAVVNTNIDNSAIDESICAIDKVSTLLEATPHSGPYSGLFYAGQDYSNPHRALPLSPIMGDCNPCRPDIQLALKEDCVSGRTTLNKRHMGLVGFAHGGITAMICDQLAALATQATGIPCVTAALTINYRKPVPLYEELSLHAHCEIVSDKKVKAISTVMLGETILAESEALMVRADKIVAKLKENVSVDESP